MNVKKIIEGIRCEDCYPRKFGQMVNDEANNLYLYLDMGGNIRCFCKKHMSYDKKGSGALLDYDQEHDYPLYGAELKSELFKRLKND